MIHATLTIDDVPSGNTRAIVDYLRSNNIQAILFAVGQRLAINPEPVVYALRQDMIVGNHSNTHPAFSGLSPEESIREIEECEKRLNEVYRYAGVERKYRPFRFPYGDKGGRNKAALQAYFARNGFSKVDDTLLPWPWWKENGLDRDIDTLWTFDFAEYLIREGSGFTVDDVWKRIREPEPSSGAPLLRENGRHILLLHAHDETEEQVPRYWELFLDFLLEKGVIFDEPRFLSPYG